MFFFESLEPWEVLDMAIMESVLRKVEVHCNGTIFQKGVQLLAYPHTYIIGHYNLLVNIIDLASHTT